LTTWFRTWSRSTELRGFAALGLWTATILLAPMATAQESLEARYQRAVDLFHAAKMEDACDSFQEIEKESPGYKDTHTYLNPACAAAKQTYSMEEKLYNEGLALYKQQQFDDAKQKFSQGINLVLKHPKYHTQMQDYLGQIDARSNEESVYKQAVQLFNEGKDDEAAKQFTQIGQGKGSHAEDARGYLQRIEDRREDSTWHRAVDLFTKNDLAGARPLLEEVVKMNGKHAAEAQGYLNQFSAREGEQRTFDEAVKAFNEKRYPAASSAFQQLIDKGGSHASEAQAYMKRIESTRKEDTAVREEAKKVTQAGRDPKQVAQQFVAEAQTAIANKQYVSAAEKLKTAELLDPENKDARSLLSQAEQLVEEQPLRQGLAAYFEGKYDDAEQHLGEYVDNHGSKLALAYFFRGAAHASRYFLSGQKDIQQRDLAFSDFRALPKSSPNFQPPKTVVSPKILDLYAQALKATAH
jgi:tetratricopeptide (TPR) repeat protein